MGTLGWLVHESVSVMHLQLPRSGRTLSSAALFENNHYVRLLNQLLQLELGSIELYARCRDELADCQLEGLLDTHRQQSKNLVNMIVTNRGIPSRDGFSFSSELSLMASRIGRHFPERLARHTTLVSCLQLEKTLRRRYHQALAEAPYRDRALLNEHTRRTKSHIEYLSSVQAGLHKV
jgi:bacterioferritin (cytochrome b1)